MSTPRITVGRWRDLAGTGVARALAGADRMRAAADRRPRAAPSAHADALLAAVAHWRPDGPDEAVARLAHLERCLAGILEIAVEQVVAVVVTNAAGSTAADLGTRLRERGWSVRAVPAGAVPEAPRGPREVLVAGWRPGLRHRHGFYLTWAHVPLLRAAAAGGRFSHLMYLEDDMRFTDAHLRYWLRYRRPLAGLGLLPGFARFEWRDGERYAVEALRPADPRARCRVARIDGEPVHFVNLENPYQALYLLDRELYAWHFRFSRGRSPLRSRVSEWEIRERAATGPIFDQVPAGLLSRNVVPVSFAGDRPRLDPACLVEHMAPTYSASAGVFGGLRVEELFGA